MALVFFICTLGNNCYNHATKSHEKVGNSWRYTSNLVVIEVVYRVNDERFLKLDQI